jgi:exoribonuclease-2
LRWLLQESVTEVTATVLREGLVRFDRLPLIVRLSDMPVLEPDTQIRVAVDRIDLVDATFESRYLGKTEPALSSA